MLFVFCGKSGSGKTAIVNALSQKTNIKILPSLTTRPKRNGEKQGIDYLFCDKRYFLHEKTLFNFYVEENDWYYGYLERDIKKYSRNDRHAIIILPPKGIRELKQSLTPFEHMVIYVHSEDEDRLMRSIKRCSLSKNCLEICRRFIQDEKDFDKLCKEIKFELTLKNIEGIKNFNKMIYELANIIKFHADCCQPWKTLD